jgi:ATP-binding cassette subfamily B protein
MDGRLPVIGRSVALLAAYALQMLFTIVSWAFMGAGALNGRVDRGWIAGWALCLTSAGLCRLAALWVEGTLTVTAVGAMRESLLAGAMAMKPDAIRTRGHAELLADVLEAESIERGAGGGGFPALLSVVELSIACVVLLWGAAPALQIPLLVGWVGCISWCAAQNTRLRTSWAATRVALTEQLVEHMMAHRTRAVQQPPDAWHAAEDSLLDRYVDQSRALDRSTGWLESATPRGYMVTALMALAPSFVSGGASVIEQAVTLGVILYVGRSLRSLTFGIPRVAAAWIAWKRIRHIAAAGTFYEREPRHAFSTSDDAVRAEGVTFTHRGRSEPSVSDCSLTIDRGDFVLLEGDSGSGKSTLVSLLAGSRRPSSGAVLCGGLDIHTVGTRAWRRRIAAVPAYHHNHVLSASFGFNVLLGRPLPHTTEDLAEARQVCREIGLGTLLERMPSGFDQMIGETGWQLSHGERSRLFLARALLQRPAVLLLDETFAALDPENLRDSLECVFRRAPSAIVIAHP